MKAVGYRQSLPISEAASLVDVELPDPKPSARDLLVHVKAVCVNPVDTKVRRSSPPPAGEVKVLGWDATGVVVTAGPEAKFFAKRKFWQDHGRTVKVAWLGAPVFLRFGL